MSHQITQDASSESGSQHRLAKAAAVVAVGALVGARARMGSALVLAGLASWLVVSRRKTAKEMPPGRPILALPPLPTADSLAGLCEPTAPFLEKEPITRSLEEIRSALIPPPSLFTPPSSDIPSIRPPESALLQSAPVYVEVAESPQKDLAAGKAVLPDTITIPVTPDPSPAMLAESSTPVTVPPPTSTFVFAPKAGLQSANATPGEKTPAQATEPKPRKNFLEWLREGRGIE